VFISVEHRAGEHRGYHCNQIRSASFMRSLSLTGNSLTGNALKTDTHPEVHDGLPSLIIPSKAVPTIAR